MILEELKMVKISVIVVKTLKMGIKYKLKLKDLKLEYLKEYFSPFLNYFKKKKKIENYSDLREFIQKKSAWVSQVTLYGYLKTRMGAKYVLMFEDEIFLGSINKAKWNIYAVALQDLTFYTISYLKNERNFHDTDKSKEIFLKILDEEVKNEIPKDIYDKAKNEFLERYEKLNWLDYHKSLPFNKSAIALYDWSPIAEELKTLDRKIVLNSMILKWENVQKEFTEILNF
tara:strand:- start:483 stop:1169 length:687 start_codon:yes stop_codon:yes gene_type:complete